MPTEMFTRARLTALGELRSSCAMVRRAAAAPAARKWASTSSKTDISAAQRGLPNGVYAERQKAIWFGSYKTMAFENTRGIYVAVRKARSEQYEYGKTQAPAAVQRKESATLF